MRSQTNVDNQNWDAISCYLFNPGRSNDFLVPNTATGGLDTVHTSNADLGFPHLKRSYYALNLHLEHPQGNGKWWGRVDYVFSRSYGNSEGQVDSDAGTRSAPSVTQAWDAAPFMEYSNGLLPNDHKHQLKIFGSYQFTPEWSVAGNLSILSGAPRNCWGAYGPDQIALIPAYGVEAYHYCGGVPSRPGDAGRTPWQKSLTLSTQYRPAFADHKLALSLEVFNVTNEQKDTQLSPYYGVSTQAGQRCTARRSPPRLRAISVWVPPTTSDPERLPEEAARTREQFPEKKTPPSGGVFFAGYEFAVADQRWSTDFLTA